MSEFKVVIGDQILKTAESGIQDRIDELLTLANMLGYYVVIKDRNNRKVMEIYFHYRSQNNLVKIALHYRHSRNLILGVRVFNFSYINDTSYMKSQDSKFFAPTEYFHPLGSALAYTKELL